MKLPTFNTLAELKIFVDAQEGSHDNDTTCSEGIQRQFDSAISEENYNGVHSIHFIYRPEQEFDATGGPRQMSTQMLSTQFDATGGPRQMSFQMLSAQFDASGDKVTYERTQDGNVVTRKWTFKDGSAKTNTCTMPTE